MVKVDVERFSYDKILHIDDIKLCLGCTPTCSVAMLGLQKNFILSCQSTQEVKMVCTNEICRRCNGKTRKRRRTGRTVQLPDWVVNNPKATYYLSYLGRHTEANFVWGISELCPKSEPFVSRRFFRITVRISTWEGAREGGQRVLNSKVRVATSCQEKISEYSAVMLSLIHI